MCTPVYRPSSPTRFNRSKTVKVKKFPLFKIWTKPLYFNMNILRQLLDPSGPPQRAQSRPFKTSLYFFYPYYALPPAIQFHLPNTFSLNTCATVIPLPRSCGGAQNGFMPCHQMCQQNPNICRSHQQLQSSVHFHCHHSSFVCCFSRTWLQGQP